MQSKVQREAKKLNPDPDFSEYVGTFETVAKFGEELTFAVGDLPDNTPTYILRHINWEAVGNELLADDFVSVLGKHGIHYYRKN